MSISKWIPQKRPLGHQRLVAHGGSNKGMLPSETEKMVGERGPIFKMQKIYQWRSQDFGSGEGEHFRESAAWGVGGRRILRLFENSPGRRRIFEDFQTISYENCKKYIILAHFSKKLTNHALIFLAFGRKTQSSGKFWEIFERFYKNSKEKLSFQRFFEKLLRKIEPSEITSFFYKNLSRFGEGFPPFPLATPLNI